MSTTTRGVRKVSENILSNGRAIIVTEKDKDKYKWSDIPVGSKFIDSKTGIEWVKLEGESDWVPAHVKNDGTLCIAKDARIITEIFKVVSINDGDGNFTYENEKGERRHMPLASDGGFVFELEAGTYVLGRNCLEVYIDNILKRSLSTGGITEVNERRFIVNDSLVNGQAIYVKYISSFKIGNPYPRVFLEKKQPVNGEEGDFWLDQNFDESTDANSKEAEKVHNIDWSEIDGKPGSFEDFLKSIDARDNFSRVGHLHHWLDIVDRPSSLPANGGNAKTVNGCSVGTNPGDILKLDSKGKLPTYCLPDNYLTDSRAIFIQASHPAAPRQNSIWFDVTPNRECIKVFVGNKWVIFGSVWKG